MPTDPEDSVETPHDWTVVLSGPLAQKGPLLASLERAGVDVSEQPDRNPQYGLEAPDDKTGWVTCRTTSHVDTVVEHASRAGWVLRAHWPTPNCSAGCSKGSVTQPDGSGVGVCLHCGGSGYTNRPPKSAEQQLGEELAALRSRLAILEKRVS